MDARTGLHPEQLTERPLVPGRAPASAAEARVAAALGELERAQGAEPHDLADVFTSVYEHLRAALDAAERS